jgi:hypothetical protein
VNRRRFLATTALSGAALTALSGAARAFTMRQCGKDASAVACDEVQRHKQILVDLRRLLQQENLSPEEQQALLAKAVCPFCGAPLLG